jgi:hypothetical protein
MIPRKIFICYKTLPFLQTPIDRWKALNPDHEIHAFDDEMCRRYLHDTFSPVHAELFDWIPAGPIKADFWRICILFAEGGFYTDADNVPLVSLRDFIEPDADLVTCTSYWHFDFNPNFIAAKAGDKTLKRCINWYLEKRSSGVGFDYWSWSVMQCFTDVLKLRDYTKTDGIFTEKGDLSSEQYKIQLLREVSGTNHYDAHNIYRNVRIFNNRSPEWNHCTHGPRE